MIPDIQPLQYDRLKIGMFGELGDGANTEIKFVQTVLSSDDLDYITLISDIPGSEQWPIRDLFQRDVDKNRIDKGLIPYFKDQSKVKFFNPLTLVLLPIDETNQIITTLESIPTEESRYDDGRPCDIINKEGFFTIKILRNDPNNRIAELRWRGSKCHLVAIDGQHRLSALKRLRTIDGNPIRDWKIPAVILIARKKDVEEPSLGVLEIVRNTFVYINTYAVTIDENRRILLDDEDCSALCVQEVIRHAHENDVMDLTERRNGNLSLLLFNWRGLNISDNHNVSLFSAFEIYEWFNIFFLPERKDFERELELANCLPPIRLVQTDKSSILSVTSSHDSNAVREQFTKTILPGITYFLENFCPITDYIQILNSNEISDNEQSIYARHAYMKLRFGSHITVGNQMDQEIKSVFDDLWKKFRFERDRIHFLIRKDVGIRAVIFSFAEIRNKRRNYGIDENWLAYSELILPFFNAIYKENWFNLVNTLSKEQKRSLTHIVYDSADGIINYRLNDIENSLGAFITCLTLKKMHNSLEDQSLKEKIRLDIAEIIENRIGKSIVKDIRKLVKSTLAPNFVGQTLNEIDNQIKQETTKLTNAHIKFLKGFIIDRY